MDRCPNCGSSVRTGAKFCTTCGFRLPVPAAPASDAPTSMRRSPFDTTSSDTVISGWTDPRPAAPVAPSAPVAVEEPDPIAAAPVEPVVEAAPGPPPAAPFSGWPAYGTGFGPRSAAWGTDPQPADRPLPEYQDVPPVPEVSKHTVEDAVEAWSAGMDLPPEPVAAEPAEAPEDDVEADLAVAEVVEPATERPDEPAPASADDLVLQAEPASEQWAWPPDSDNESSGLVEPEEAVDAAAAVAEEESVEASADSSAEQAEDSGEVAADATVGDDAAALADDVVPLPVPAESQIDPADRAAKLVTELQELLPLLAAKSETAVVDVAAVTTVLDEAIAAGASEAETFSSLRAAVATAQARPRDVDVMLDLVARADAMAGLFAAHDRYKAALERAAQSLKGESENEPAPRW